MTTTLILTIAAIFILLIFSAFFSGSETALTAASKARLHRLARDGNKRAQKVKGLIEEPERLIGGILLGNNLVNILASALATSALISIFGDEGVVYATLIMTFLVLIFSEVLPKTYAITNPDQVSLKVGPLIGAIVYLFSPIVFAVQKIVTATLLLFGMDIEKLRGITSATEEIRGTIDLQESEGGIHKTHRDMLGSILDLDEVVLEDIMVHRSNMTMLDINLKTEKLVEVAVKSPHTRIPLYEGSTENIVGVLHARDLLRAFFKKKNNYGKLSIRRIMKRPWFVPETTTLKEQLNGFLDKKRHFALVVDEYGALMGMVTLEDILEEIVGDIADEHDFEVEGLKELPDGGVLCDGDVTLRDLKRQMDWNLPDGEATTVAGLVIFESEVIPTIGQKFTFHGFRFQILERKRNQITRLMIKKV